MLVHQRVNQINIVFCIFLGALFHMISLKFTNPKGLTVTDGIACISSTILQADAKSPAAK